MNWLPFLWAPFVFGTLVFIIDGIRRTFSRRDMQSRASRVRMWAFTGVMFFLCVTSTGVAVYEYFR